MDWKNKKVAVVGLGIEGLSSAKFLHEKRAEVWLLDKKKKEDLDPDFISEAERLGAHLVLGDDYLEDLSDFSVIVRSPGVKHLTQELTEAEKKGIVITSQTKIFFDLCPGKIIGVTGTKGKGTTASLIYEMLKASGKDVYLGGNIGTPPFDFLDKLNKDSWVVLELSSFQLQDLDRSPSIAVMLMVTSEHLDYHANVLEYIDAKRNLLRFQTADDFAILNRDYPATNESDIHTEGKVLHVSREREVGEGCFVKDKKVILRKDSNDTEIISTKDILLPGGHNLENICAAVLAASLAGVSKDSIVKVLKTFKGLEHRLELVAEINGVRYYDDSFSTTPETAIAAIEAFENPEVLILGGSSKQSDFSELGKGIRKAKNIKAIIGIGEEWERIKQEIGEGIQDSDILLVEGAKSMHQIVQAAAKIAQSGDVVLLSPACASFDMFKNYKDRGEQFKEEIRRL